MKGEGRCSWTTKETIEEIRCMLNGFLEVHIDHIYREGKRVVDDLAKFGHNMEGIKESDDIRHPIIHTNDGAK
jgi:hypothetical protein